MKAQKLWHISVLRPNFDSSRITRIFYAVFTAGALVGCQTGFTQEGYNASFPIIVGASKGSELWPCADYADRLSLYGTSKYKVYASGRVKYGHQGIDFCAQSGTPVIAGTTGKVVWIVEDDEVRGGRVTIETKIMAETKIPTILPGTPIYLDYLHITPATNIRYDVTVKAGDIIGWLQEGDGKPEIGPRPHVHFSAGYCSETYLCHTDPHLFWQKGEGIVTCFDPKNPPKETEIVAPLRCD